jgi:hypothetical protein
MVYGSRLPPALAPITGSRKLRYRSDPYELLPEGRLRKLAE